jgi:aminoacyl tRNA synthase complex-interacting multifunctional protein 1
MAFKFLVAAESPLRPAVELILSLAKIPPGQVDASGPVFGVVLPSSDDASGCITGVSALLRTLSQQGASPPEFFTGAPGAENQAVFNQWVTAAAQVACRALTTDAIESIIGSGSNAAIAGTPDATAADALLYCAVIKEVAADARRLPQLAKWCQFVASATTLEPLRVGIQASASGEKAAAPISAQQQQQQPAKPNAEEIERRRLEKEKAKAEKAAAVAAQPKDKAAEVAKAPAPAKATPSSEVSSTQLDVRVGLITTIGKHPDAEKLYVESIDLGNGEVRSIVSGLVEHYKPEELHGSLCLVVCNMKPKALKGVTSQGMVLCASTAAVGDAPARLELVKPALGTAPGTRVSFAGRLAPELPPIPSNTVIVELLAHLKTDGAGVVGWKDEPAAAAGAPISTKLPNAVVK